MVLYEITLVPFAKELRVADLGSYPCFTRMLRHLPVWHDKVHRF